jgi:Cellulase (glycosyl hydrolase family 5)
VLATSARPAHAAKGMEIALQDDASFVSELRLKRKKALKLAAQLHVTRIRVNLPWVAIVNKPGKKKRPKHRHYDFTSYDALYNKARSRGIKLQLTISGKAPAWATGNHHVGCYKIKVSYFKEFVRAVARHFKRASDRYAVWNEPNYRSWNAPLEKGAATYRKMYLTAYKQIRKIDPKAKILIGETSPYGEKGTATSPIKFLRDVARGGKLKADGYAHHPYDFAHGPDWPAPRNDNAAINNLRNLTDALDKLAKAKKLTTPGGKPLDLYLTEYGFMATGRRKKPASQRAKYLPRAFQIALDNPRVKEMLHYLLAPPPRWSSYFDTSIVTRKGKPTKPFKALAAWTAKQAQRRMIALPRRP